MSKVRVISQGTTSNYEAFCGLVKRMCAHVEEHEPGARACECFAEEVSGQVLWHEMYENADAFLAHVQGLIETGLMDELMQVYTIDRITSLVRVTDERATEVLQQFGAPQLHGVGGIVRWSTLPWRSTRDGTIDYGEELGSDAAARATARTGPGSLPLTDPSGGAIIGARTGRNE